MRKMIFVATLITAPAAHGQKSVYYFDRYLMHNSGNAYFMDKTYKYERRDSLTIDNNILFALGQKFKQFQMVHTDTTNGITAFKNGSVYFFPINTPLYGRKEED